MESRGLDATSASVSGSCAPSSHIPTGLPARRDKATRYDSMTMCRLWSMTDRPGSVAANLTPVER